MILLKRTPTYDLNSIKEAFDCPENLVMTSSAKRGQIELDLSDHDMVAVIQALTTKDFYKSMYIKLASTTLIYISNFKLMPIEN